MRIAALYDIHGNAPALEAVLDDVHRADVDAIVVGGDVVPGPMPRETIALLRSVTLPLHAIQGNGDRETLAKRAGIETGTVPPRFRHVIGWVAGELYDDDVRLLSAWTKTLRLDIDGIGEVFFCHATPRNDVDIFTRDTPEDRLAPLFADVGAPLVVCGHTHMQFDRTIAAVRVVNAGSVGMPFAPPGAYWLLLGPDVELRHTPYDLTAAADRLRQTGYPEADQFAAENVLQPPSENTMRAAYNKISL
jgi:putative phosphoesterase